MKRCMSAMLCAAFLVLGSTSPAFADANIGFSSDGATFADALSRPLFGSDLRWVPGDERGRTFFVRNEGETRAVMAVDYIGRDVDGLLETGDLTVRASVDGGPAGSAATDGTHRLVSDVVVPASGVARVDVDVVFDPSSENLSQLRAMELDFMVRFTQDEVLSRSESVDDAATADGNLPGTGAQVSLAALVTASTLVLTGLVLVARNRRSEGVTA